MGGKRGCVLWSEGVCPGETGRSLPAEAAEPERDIRRLFRPEAGARAGGREPAIKMAGRNRRGRSPKEGLAAAETEAPGGEPAGGSAPGGSADPAGRGRPPRRREGQQQQPDPGPRAESGGLTQGRRTPVTGSTGTVTRQPTELTGQGFARGPGRAPARHRRRLDWCQTLVAGNPVGSTPGRTPSEGLVLAG